MSDFSDDDAFAEALQAVETTKSASSSRTTVTNWNAIQVHPDQSQNPILELISQVPWQVGQTAVDFQTAPDVGVLYLSLKYYNYRPKYLEQRVEELKSSRNTFRLLVLIVLVDQTNADIACRHLSIMAAKLNLSMVVAFNAHEAAKYIETLKIYAKKGPETLKPKFEESERMQKLLQVSKAVNSTG